MSVLLNHRQTSKAEFINVAYEISVKATRFLVRLSARYARILSKDTGRLANEVIEYAEKANSVFPKDDLTTNLRREYLLRSRAALMALDVRLSFVYDTLMLNPQGCYNNTKGKTMTPKDAVEKIDAMSLHIGELIDRENALLTGALKALDT